MRVVGAAEFFFLNGGKNIVTVEEGDGSAGARSGDAEDVHGQPNCTRFAKKEERFATESQRDRELEKEVQYQVSSVARMIVRPLVHKHRNREKRDKARLQIHLGEIGRPGGV